MNEKVSLSVLKDSHHIWRGRLSDIESAEWLICKTNAIINRAASNKERKNLWENYLRLSHHVRNSSMHMFIKAFLHQRMIPLIP